jgi:hypothetical protein
VRDIGIHFGMNNYSSVGSVITRKKQRWLRIEIFGKGCKKSKNCWHEPRAKQRLDPFSVDGGEGYDILYGGIGGRKYYDKITNLSTGNDTVSVRTRVGTGFHL